MSFLTRWASSPNRPLKGVSLKMYSYDDNSIQLIRRELAKAMSAIKTQDPKDLVHTVEFEVVTEYLHRERGRA
jgi:hypothetical protein